LQIETSISQSLLSHAQKHASEPSSNGRQTKQQDTAKSKIGNNMLNKNAAIGVRLL